MIYICMPAHNEGRTVGVVLWKIRRVMTEFPRDYQLLVVDDGSTDTTPEVLQPYTRVLPLSVSRSDERRGYARALETLLAEAARRSRYPRRDVVVTLSADFSDEPEEIPALVRRIEAGADVVTTAADVRNHGVPRGLRWTRWVIRYVLGRLGWPEAVTDPLTGFRAYRVQMVRKAFEAANGRRLLRSEGWAANAELLQRVVPFARRIDETAVSLRYDRRQRPSRFQPWAALREAFELVRGGRTAGLGASADSGADALEPRVPRPPRARPQIAEPAREAREEKPDRPPRRRGGRRGRGGQTARAAGEAVQIGGLQVAAQAELPAVAAVEALPEEIPLEGQAQAGGQRRRRSRRGRSGARRRGGRKPQPGAGEQPASPAGENGAAQGGAAG